MGRRQGLSNLGSAACLKLTSHARTLPQQQLSFGDQSVGQLALIARCGLTPALQVSPGVSSRKTYIFPWATPMGKACSASRLSHVMANVWWHKCPTSLLGRRQGLHANTYKGKVLLSSTLPLERGGGQNDAATSVRCLLGGHATKSCHCSDCRLGVYC